MTTAVLMHYITPNSGRVTTTLCGCRIIPDRRATTDAIRSGNWVTCPVCELAKTLDDIGFEDKPQQSRDDSHRPNHGWTQPTLFS